MKHNKLKENIDILGILVVLFVLPLVGISIDRRQQPANEATERRLSQQHCYEFTDNYDEYQACVIGGGHGHTKQN